MLDEIPEWREKVLTQAHLSFAALYDFEFKLWLEMSIGNEGIFKTEPFAAIIFQLSAILWQISHKCSYYDLVDVPHISFFLRHSGPYEDLWVCFIATLWKRLRLMQDRKWEVDAKTATIASVSTL